MWNVLTADMNRISDCMTSIMVGLFSSLFLLCADVWRLSLRHNYGRAFKISQCFFYAFYCRSHERSRSLNLESVNLILR